MFKVIVFKVIVLRRLYNLSGKQLECQIRTTVRLYREKLAMAGPAKPLFGNRSTN